MRGSGIVLAGLLALTTGCRPGVAPQPIAVAPPVAAPAAPVPGPPAKKGVGFLKRSIDITEIRYMLQQLGLAYANFELTENRAPKERKDLSPYYENNGKINAALDKGDIVFGYGVKPQQMPQGAANTVLAYEASPDETGRRIVLMGNGQVRDMDEATFNQAPKAAK